jgi:hypothetical protein
MASASIAAIKTIGKKVGQREPRNYREVNPQQEPQPSIDVAPASLPSFITAAPRIPAPVEILDTPQPVLTAPVEPPQSVEAPAPTSPEEAPAEARAPRRRRRLRSPFGFNAGEEAAPGSGPTSE